MNKVHADYKLSNGGSNQVTDGDGNQNGWEAGCASESGWYSPNITSHRTCEEKLGWPDNCGSWVNT